MSSAITKFSRIKSGERALFIAQRLDRIEPGGLHRWIDAEEDPDGERHSEPDRDRPGLDRVGQRRPYPPAP